MWDTCKYIRRMKKRLEERPHSCKFKALLYEHGTHFVFPETLLKIRRRLNRLLKEEQMPEEKAAVLQRKIDAIDAILYDKQMAGAETAK